jgi:hypothetical protein
MKGNLTEPMSAVVTIECNPEEVTVIVNRQSVNVESFFTSYFLISLMRFAARAAILQW